MQFEVWVHSVDRLMRRDWCIGTADAGLSHDELKQVWHDGEAPAAFVNWFAEKYDLTRYERSPYGLRTGRR
jgi:hypothetical protein